MMLIMMKSLTLREETIVFTYNPGGRGVSLERRSELSGIGALLKGT